MRVIQIACICFILLIANSCKNDIEINAPWKETPVVYAFVDPNTSTQFFRIQKTYQNSTNLTTAEGALITDSLYFDTLSVKVTDGSTTYLFQKSKNVPKDDGFFASGAHFLYECKNFTGVLSRNYTLHMYSPKTGNTYSASTRCIGPSAVSTVALRFDATNVNSTSTIKTTRSSEATTYSQIMRLVYLEYPIGTTGGDTLYADYIFSDQLEKYNVTNGNFKIRTQNFVNGIKNTIPEKSGKQRKIIRIDFINVGGGKELADLIEISKPSLSIVQKRVDYTNITDGLGIFSSRSYKLTANIQNLDTQWPGTQKQYLINALNALDYTGIVSKNLQFVP
jgi:hypothetical protein